jgi:UDP-N-acetylglucosamine--N-acetylmuramyl-(pentapeptide) pyrophosphoryl-undecaprenol N-acetylglucosamine transferase
LQEQNSYPGLTTRVISRWARQVHLGFPEARQQLNPGKHTEVTALGNPIRPPDTSIDRFAARAHFGLRADSTVILVVGGSQGSRAVNQALLEAIGRSEVRVPGEAGKEILWATGPNNYEPIAARLAQMNELGWVKAVAYINDMPRALAATDVAVSRAGAMATAELLAWGIPSLLIPLPTAAADHQTHNARALSEAGAAVMLLEKDLSGSRLWHELIRITNDAPLRSRMAAAAQERARPNAAREIAQRLSTLLT